MMSGVGAQDRGYYGQGGYQTRALSGVVYNIEQGPLWWIIGPGRRLPIITWTTA